MHKRANSDPVNLQADIVIAGGGGAGLAASVAAAEKGTKNIIVLEERRVPCGNAVFPDGIFAAESPIQKRMGIVCKKDNIFKIATEYSHWRINPSAVRALINKSADTISWLEKMGVKFETVAAVFPHDEPWTMHVTKGPGKTGSAVVKTLLKRSQELGVKIFCQTKVKKLITDNKGKVVGVQAEGKNGEIKVTARSVIISTGGFSGNIEMLKKYLPNYVHEEIHHSGTLRNGDGIQMAVEIGAAMEDMFAIEITPYIEFTCLPFIIMRPETVWLNKRGERFVDEGVTALFTEAANSIHRQPEKMYYTFLDEKLLNKFKQDVLSKRTAWVLMNSHEDWAKKLDETIKVQVDKGKIKISDSLEEIASWMGLSSRVLHKTLNEYNAFCDKGYDRDFVKDKKYLLQLCNPPYYAIRCCTDSAATHGGLKINQYMQVMDKKGNPISGLYAAGLDIGGTESETYNTRFPGHSYGFTINSGRIAGEHAAKRISAALPR
jgi:fumarate reductase flavoprotein subunit